jgi:cobalt/nickel transport system permease protein
MHISEGILSAPVLVTGAALTATAVGYSLKKMEHKEVPKVAILSSVFFVASLIHVPVGPSSVHLILNGIIGVLLGWSAFPAILVALALQGVLFQFGGITTLGVNTFNMALPAIICFYLFNRGVRGENNFIVLMMAFVCGFLAVLLSGIMVAVALVFTGEQFIQVAKLVIIAHLPVMILEGVFTAFCIGFLRKVRPEILNA